MAQPEAPPSPPSPPPPPVKERSSYGQKIWVPIVIVIGFLLGEVIYYASVAPQISTRGGIGGIGPGYCPGPICQFPHFNNELPTQFHIVLTTISIALLIALLAVYVRMYLDTKANFALGLVVVLFALLVESLLSYPLLIGFIGTIYLGPGLTSEFADTFTVCAYAVFLYLSLE